MGSIEGFADTICTKCKANKAIIEANTPQKSLEERENEVDREWGCVFKLAIIGAVVYFSYNYIKKWFSDPLEYNVKVEVANFRKDPNESSKIIKKLKKGDEFILLNDSSFNENKKWGLGTNSNDTGWIYMNLVEQ